VSHLDLYPTLTELAGIKAPANLQGQSLVPMLNDPNAVGRGWALTQVSRGGGKNRATVSRDKTSDGKRIFGYSLRTLRWRYTEWDEGNAGTELYDHDNDPGELVNLAAKPEHAKTVAELSAQVRAAAKATFPADGQTPELKEGPLWAPTLVDP
jgi:iduronate 2-sulfatase